MKKTLTLIAVISIIVISILPNVAASSVTIYSNSVITSNFTLLENHPSGTGDYSGRGIAFTALNTGYVTTVSVRLWKVGSPQGDFQCFIEYATGTDNAYLPNGTVIASSTTILSETDISTTPSWETFSFDGTDQLTSGQNYTLYVALYNKTLSWPSSYFVIENDVEPDATANGISYNAGSWSISPFNYHTSVTIAGDTSSGVTPTPTPTATPGGAPTELTEIWATVGDLIGLLVPLLVVLLPAFFGYKFAGAWGFLAGINVGAILAYVILGAATFPLWGIVAILILDALLLFGKVGFRT